MSFACAQTMPALGRTHRIELDETMRLRDMPTVLASMREALRDQTARIELDLGNVRFATEAAHYLLAAASERLRQQDIELVVINHEHVPL